MESLIFVALAVAWLVYLVPKGLKMHEESKQMDAVENFSDDLRVVARRDPGVSLEAELTVSTSKRPKVRAASATSATPAAADRGAEQTEEISAPVAEVWQEPVATSGATRRVRRIGAAVARSIGRIARGAYRVLGLRALVGTLARRRNQPKAPITAAGRRRRVLGSLLVLTALVAGLAAFGVVSWWGLALPLVLTLGWLGACRAMVLGERGRRTGARRGPSTPPARTRGPRSVEETLVGAVDAVATDAARAPAGSDEPHTPYASRPAGAAPGSWEMVPMTLPTYVTKDVAEPRAPKPFRLDSTGVWSSGRSEIDSEIARRAEQDAAAAREAARYQRERKLGS